MSENDQLMLNEDAVMEEDTTRDKYLTFTIDEEQYGIEISRVVEIITVPAIAWLPDNPEYIKGVINLRGSIIPVIEVRSRFRKVSKEYDSLTCIVVIDYENYTVGLIVDTVNEVMYIPEEKTSNPPSAKLKYQNQFIRNIGKIGDDVQLLLDLDKFLFLE